MYLVRKSLTTSVSKPDGSCGHSPFDKMIAVHKNMKRILSILAVLVFLTGNSLYAQQSTGSLTASGSTCVDGDGTCVVVQPNQDSTLITIGITGTWSATNSFEFQPLNSTAWSALTCTNLVSYATASSATSNGSFACLNLAFASVRVRQSAHSSGTASIIVRASQSNAIVGVQFGGGGGASIGSVSQGAASDASNNWTVNCVQGCSGSTTDTDDGSVAVSQVSALTINENHVYDGTVWRRQTIGTAGTAAAQVYTVQGIASMTPILATLSGTNNINNISGTISIPTGASTAAKQPALGTAGSASSDVITVQGVASMTPVLATLSGTNNIATVTAVTGITNALPAGSNVIGHIICDSGCSSTTTADASTFTYASTSLATVGGVYNSSITDLASGKSGAFALDAHRTIHVGLYDTTGAAVNPAADATSGSTALTTGPQTLIEFETSPSAVTSGQSIQLHGSSKGELFNVIRDAAGNGRGANVNSSNELLVNPGTVTIAAVPTGTNTIGSVKQTDGTTVVSTNPCQSTIPTQVAISQTASTKVISQTSAKKNYICSIVIVVGAAEITNIVEGTGSTCGTSTAAIAGSTTAANGMSFAANGGFSAIGGSSNVLSGIGTNVDTCITQSGSNRVAGWLTYVQQ
jgi:hypothetical protein